MPIMGSVAIDFSHLDPTASYSHIAQIDRSRIISVGAGAGGVGAGRLGGKRAPGEEAVLERLDFRSGCVCYVVVLCMYAWSSC